MRAELEALPKDEDALQDSFYKEMEFGTAGMRGIIGMGTNRMNVFTVKRATQALANNILAHGDPAAGVAVAYDTRKYSDLFCTRNGRRAMRKRHQCVYVRYAAQRSPAFFHHP